jgi:hypothetical protein
MRTSCLETYGIVTFMSGDDCQNQLYNHKYSTFLVKIMAYKDIRFQKAQFKTSHNSYERKEDFHQQLAWDPDHPYEGGCRGVECDIWRRSDASLGTSVGYFLVGHVQPGAHSLADYLGYLLSFHVNNPRHDPILVHIDIKSTQGSYQGFPDEIDRYISSWFDRNLIFKPSDLTADMQNLVAASVENKWPTIGELRDKFLFCLTGNSIWKGYYADHMDTSSLCFADMDLSDAVSDISNLPLPLNRIFLNFHLYKKDYKSWEILIPNLNRRGYISRGWVIDDAELWYKAIQAGLNILATDQVKSHPWAQVGNMPFEPINLGIPPSITLS